jgi:mRNA interferase RelE/StbE
VRDIRNLDPTIRPRVDKKLLRYKEDPLKYAEKITDPKLGSYRFRIGDYRVIFDLEGKDIVILRVGHRRDIYRR